MELTMQEFKYPAMAILRKTKAPATVLMLAGKWLLKNSINEIPIKASVKPENANCGKSHTKCVVETKVPFFKAASRRFASTNPADNIQSIDMRIPALILSTKFIPFLFTLREKGRRIRS
ncbi:hypothetical protein FRX31_033142 [Thalictrum thalictroides]|uniref:Uncharacterized protein n=1 Tax=Thalictrum thalictroides TaxID=46969 RepID=A0A7J6UYR1_THATH|nr:hypothetical protein FRX31_033142 [Thalictrum thalictroides]